MLVAKGKPLLEYCKASHLPPTPIIWEGKGLSNWANMMVSVLHEKLERKVEKLKYKFMQPRIKNKSELPTYE